MTEVIVLEKLPASSSGMLMENSPIKRRRVYIFMTRQGMVFIIMLIVMLLGAINYNNSMAYALTFTLGSMFIVCMLHTYRNLRGLLIRTSNAEPVFCGQICHYPVLIDNRTGQSRIAIDLQVSPRKKSRIKHEPVSINIAANSLQRTHLGIKTAKRGYHNLERFQITSTFPLGLFKTWSYADNNQQCLVYPRPTGKTQLPAISEYDSEDLIGTQTGTDDFIGYQSYRAGDSISSIDWKVFAREQGLLIKRFSGSGSQKLILDWQHCNHIQNLEQRLSQLCLWILEAEKLGIRYGLNIPGTSINPDQGEAHQNLCLSTLAKYGNPE